jgi:hypothetical protein
MKNWKEGTTRRQGNGEIELSIQTTKTANVIHENGHP